MIAMDGVTKLPKTQKNAQLDEGLCEIVDIIQRKTGATFSRIVTASMLRYLFGNLQPPPDALGTIYDGIWMTLSVDLERDENFTIADVPHALYDACSKSALQTIKHVEAIKKPTRVEEELKGRAIAYRGNIRGKVKIWDQMIEHAGGKLEALKMVLQSHGFPTPEPTGYIGAMHTEE